MFGAPKQISTGFASWLHYCTAFKQWAPAILCSIEQRAPAIFGRAAITLGILVKVMSSVKWPRVGPRAVSKWVSV